MERPDCEPPELTFYFYTDSFVRRLRFISPLKFSLIGARSTRFKVALGLVRDSVPSPTAGWSRKGLLSKLKLRYVTKFTEREGGGKEGFKI